MSPFLLTLLGLLLAATPCVTARPVRSWTATELWQKADCVALVGLRVAMDVPAGLQPAPKAAPGP